MFKDLIENKRNPYVINHIPFCRHLLHHCFQALMDHGASVSDILADTYANQLAQQTSQDPASRERTIQLGFQLGNH